MPHNKLLYANEAVVPEDLIEYVVDKQSFLIFAEALRQDREESDAIESKNPSSPFNSAALGWNNGSIESFLEAAIAWADDTNFGELRLKGVSQWRLFAEFLLAGKQYE
ncbi:hypothetical protein [Colwellia sp. RSH04]|uniref:DUF7660 family protein n=1 Tax=Colwellia sp. RSH04 TaxID=2305464 RepID=UPI0011C22A7F|nr:hypothetical protein [Colwellia sp. RSH04]